jgi:3',5'-cyclic AMP phosphodiesterase CpdA
MLRRDFLLASALTPLAAPAAPVAPARRSGRRALRLAHLTDVHVLPVREGLQDPPGGFAAAIRHAQALPDRPDLMFFGGDLIMDGLKVERDETVAQWDVWDSVLRRELQVPARFALGNHDIWGWGIRGRPGLEREKGYGKALALERLALPDRYYSFDQNGWHFVVLDSMQPDFANKHSYTASLDEVQFAWLARDLAAVPPTTPIAILSHIPILSACVFFDNELEATGSWVVPGAWTHIDARRLKDLFRRHPNVKVCLSGHVHLVDDVTYLGVRYLCNGAVSGGWWKGDYQEFPPAYAIVDFYEDGTVERQLMPYRSR